MHASDALQALKDYPLDDAFPIVADHTDATKRLRIDVGAITTGTTRVLTIPDADVDLSTAYVAADNVAIEVGSSADLSIVHNGTDTIATTKTGDFVVDNTLVTGSTIMRLGTDTTATDFQVQNNTAAALLTVTPLTAAAGRVDVTGIIFQSVTTVDMADAAHALVLAAAGAGETRVLGNIIYCDPNSGGASEILTLPAEASSTGLELKIVNTGGEGIVVKDDAAATVLTLDTAQHGTVVCNGTTWFGWLGNIT